MIGQTVNHYRILEKLGAGGMGEVYAAEDTKLNRKVAIKVLPPEMAASPERLGRFEREAKAIASLNHPNIVHIYSIERSDPGDSASAPVNFLTMELVAGRPLGRFISKGGMDVSRILEIGLALAEAMTAAHEKSITHRDLKPENIMIGDDGRLKILDFGLAKLRDEAAAAPAGSELPTREFRTEDGRILGTVAYMSPEQAEGKEVNPRSDIFTIGILLYEMATGERPFKGDSRISILSSIMKDTPTSVTELNRRLPRDLGRIVRRCLAKNPDRRYGNARELHNDLLELKEDLDSGELPAPGPLLQGRGAPAARLGPFTTWGIIAILAAVVVILLLRGPGGGGPVPPATLDAALTRVTDLPGTEFQPSLSPDGKTIAYAGLGPAGDLDIFIRRAGGEKAINLTEDSPEDDLQPAFSPDGDLIVFRSERSGGGLFLMGAMGESVRRLTSEGYLPTWSPDGNEILYSTDSFTDATWRTRKSEIRSISIQSGEERVVVEGRDAIQPAWSPHGHRIAFWGAYQKGGQRDLWTVPAGGGAAVALTDDPPTDWNPIWSPDGSHLYFASNRGGSMNLWRVPVDEETGEALGEPEPITTGVSQSGWLTISPNETRLVYSVDTSESSLQKIPFDPASGDVTGPPIRVTRGATPVQFGTPSPDGEWVAFCSRGSQENIFVARADGTGQRQLTDDASKKRFTAWSPDGERIVFISDRSGSYEIWSIRSDGSDLRQITDAKPAGAPFPVWSPDGSRIVSSLEPTLTVIFDPDLPWAEQIPQIVPNPEGEDGHFFPTSWSPDGKRLAGFGMLSDSPAAGWILYSLETGEFEMIFQPESDSDTVWLEGAFWLNDNRRLILSTVDSIFLLEPRGGEPRMIFSASPDQLIMTSLSSDEREIYFVRISSQSDLWMLELK